MKPLSVQQVGGSLMVTIPDVFAERLHIMKGTGLVCGLDLIGDEFVLYYRKSISIGNGNGNSSR